MTQNEIRWSKFLSLVLRHKPETIGLALDGEGWADVTELMRLARAQGHDLSREVIERIVAANDKQRFRLSQDGKRIRANQGHSFAVNLGLDPVLPPPSLYHGTATRFADSIGTEGILPKGRQYVHLSADIETAVNVGQRHGTPTVFVIDALRMHGDGHCFFLAENSVWLTAHVPPQYLRQG